MIDLLRKAYDGGANGLRTITCVMLFGVFLGGANSHVKASDSKTLTAHQKTTKNATTLSTSTQSNKAQLDVSKLVGADPENLALTKDSISHRINPNTKYARKTTFLLLNVATEKFFNIGGAYGRHASLSNTGMYLWIWNDSKTPETYNIRTRLNYIQETKDVNVANLDNTDSYIQYLDNKEKDKQEPGIYPDCQPTDATRSFGWKFVKAKGYSEINKVYTISTYGDKFLTATPDDKDGNLCKAETFSDSDNQVWKLVTLQEYYDLFKNSPSDLTSPIDITFLLQNPGFGYNKSNAPFWAPSREAHYLRLGVEDYYKKTTEDYYKNNKEERIYDFNDNLYENGKYFCADIKNQHKYNVTQSINVTQPGWYIIRCNGFSNTNFANLFISNVVNYLNYIYYGIDDNITASPLKEIDANVSPNLLEAGKKFYNGEYENEVKVYVSQDDINYMGGEETLYFGIMLKGDANTSADGEWTAFDNFRLLYAGESANAPNLVLDEDNPDLKYLTETIDEYNKCNLHLKRSFELNKWNTLILPVSLTYGQMKEAFGNEVKLAELYKLTPNSVRFKTVECNSDDEVMLEAFTPYIIKPTKAAGENSAYTTPRLLKEANQYWLGENEGISYEEEGVERYTGGKVSIKENHYDISGVTLDRSLLNKNLDKHWVSTTTTSTTASDADNNKMVCKGTMAKTFYIKNNKEGAFYNDDNEERDKLSGDYFMNKGTMYKVPAEKQYGLKAFRCWFELTNTTDAGINSTSQAKDVKLFINEIEDETTGIGDIITDPAFSHAAYQYDGVYNLQGQLVRQGTSLEGLPQGIYIVKGKKVKR